MRFCSLGLFSSVRRAAVAVFGLLAIFASGGARAALPVSGSAFHVDASNFAKFTTVTNDGVIYVTQWRDASGGSIRADATDAVSGVRVQKPYLGWDEGLVYVDFGTYYYPKSKEDGYGGGLYWNTEDSSIREVYLVFSDYPNQSGAFLLGHYNVYNFHRSGKRLFHADYASANLRNGTVQVDGATVSATGYELPEGFHIIRLKTTGNVSAKAFGLDRTCFRGGMRLREVIVYNKTLTDDEAQSTYEYLDEKWVTLPDALYVTGTPGEIDADHVAYGLKRGLKADDAVACTAPASWTSTDGLTTATCTGWKLYDRTGAQVASGTGTTCDYVHPGVYRKLVWQWNIGYKVTATAGSAGTVTNAEQWVTHGGTFNTLAAPADESKSFYRWTDGDGNVVGRDAALALTVTKPLALTANFGGTYYISKYGTADGDGTSWKTAALNPGDFIPTLPGGSTVIVSNGTYSVTNDWLYITNDVKVVSLNGPDVTTLNAAFATSDNRHLVWMDAAGARLSGFKVTGGNYNRVRGGKWYTNYPGGAYVLSGVITNCVIAGNIGSDDAGGVHVKGGTLVDCVIRGNRAYRSNNSGVGYGGGLRIDSGLAENCVITNNSGNGTKTHQGSDFAGGGVYQSGGTVRRCLIARNTVPADGRSGSGVALTGGTMEFCRIVDNGSTGAVPGNGTVYVSGTGRLVNCLVTGGRVSANGGGVYQDGGTVAYCTIAGNKSTGGATGGLYQNAGTVCNSVIFDNGDPLKMPTCNVAYQKGTYTGNVSDWVPVADAGNVGDNPKFVNPETRDYTLGTGSPAIDTAVDVAGVAADVDLDGNMRPKDGDGDGVAVNDRGCYEAKSADEGDLRCSFAPLNVRVLGVATNVTFTADVGGTGSKGELHYEWDFGGGTVTNETSDLPEVTARFVDARYYSVRLIVTAANGRKATNEVANVVGIGSSKVYVNTTGSDEWPYATSATAARDFVTAFSSMMTIPGVTNEIVVGDGTFPLKAEYVKLSMPIWLHSENGPAKTTLQAKNPENGRKQQCLRVAHGGVLVEGLTLSNGNWDGYSYGANTGAGVVLSAGVVSNCVVTGARASVECVGGVYMSGGLLTHSTVTECYSDQGGSGWAHAYGGGVWLEGGLMEHCTVMRCYVDKYSTAADLVRGGGVYVTGSKAIVRNCRIVDNYTSYSGVFDTRFGCGSQIYISAGLVKDCEIGSMKKRTVYAPGIYQTGGEIRNSLVRGICSKDTVQALELVGGAFVNNTVVTNGYTSYAAAFPIAAKVTGGGMTNCVVSANACTNLCQTAGCVAYSYADDAPLFKNPVRGDWRLKLASPCVNAGVKLDWMTEDATDLFGNLRVQGLVPDMGCYENPNNGLLLIVR